MDPFSDCCLIHVAWKFRFWNVRAYTTLVHVGLAYKVINKMWKNKLLSIEICFLNHTTLNSVKHVLSRNKWNSYKINLELIFECIGKWDVLSVIVLPFSKKWSSLPSASNVAFSDKMIEKNLISLKYIWSFSIEWVCEKITCNVVDRRGLFRFFKFRHFRQKIPTRETTQKK